jgi:acyl dehydratase
MDGPLTSTSVEILSQRVGEVIGHSDWMRLDQKTIDLFAVLTEDTYFIHVNPERAREETPFGGTIAHGFLTLSMLANMAYQAVPALQGTRTGVNYGFNKLRFVSPVRSGSRVRGRFMLQAFEHDAKRWTATWDVTIEIEGEERPAIAAQWLTAGLF